MGIRAGPEHRRRREVHGFRSATRCWGDHTSAIRKARSCATTIGPCCWHAFMGHFPLILLTGGSLRLPRSTPGSIPCSTGPTTNSSGTCVPSRAGVASLTFRFTFSTRCVAAGTARRPRTGKVQAGAHSLSCVFVVGEGIARESLTLLGCLPLFVLCGYEGAVEIGRPERAGRRSSPLRRVSSSRRSSAGGSAA